MKSWKKVSGCPGPRKTYLNSEEGSKIVGRIYQPFNPKGKEQRELNNKYTCKFVKWEKIDAKGKKRKIVFIEIMIIDNIVIVEFF